MLWVSKEPPSSLTRSWRWSQWCVHCVSPLLLLHDVSVWTVSAWAERTAALYSSRSSCNLFFEQGQGTATQLPTWTPSSPSFGKCLQYWSQTASYLPNKGKSTNLFSLECCGNSDWYFWKLPHLLASRSRQHYNLRIFNMFSMGKQCIQPAWVTEDDSTVYIHTVTCRRHNNKTLILHFCILSLQMFMGRCSAFVWEGTKLCLFRGGRWWRRPWWRRLITLWTVLTVQWSPGSIPETQVNIENTQVVYNTYWKITSWLSTKFSGFSLVSAGLFFSNGAVWRRQRRFAMAMLRTFSLTKGSMEQRIWEESQQVQEAMETEKGGPKTKERLDVRTHANTHIRAHKQCMETWLFFSGEPFDPVPLLNNAVANIICQIVFGRRFDYGDAIFQRMLDNLTQMAYLEGSIWALVRYSDGRTMQLCLNLHERRPPFWAG